MLHLGQESLMSSSKNKGKVSVAPRGGFGVQPDSGERLREGGTS